MPKTLRLIMPFYGATIGFSIFLLLIVVQGYLFFDQQSKMRTVSALVTHSESVIDQTNMIMQQVHKGIHEAELPEQAKLDADFKELAARAGSETQQLKNVGKLYDLSVQYLESIRQEKAASRSSMAYKNLSDQKKVQRMAMASTLRAVSDSIISMERKYLRKYRPESQQQQTKLVNVLIVAVCVTYAVLLTTIILSVMALFRIQTTERNLYDREIDFKAAADSSLSGFLLFRRHKGGFTLDYLNQVAKDMWDGVYDISSSREIKDIFSYVADTPEQVQAMFHKIFTEGRAQEREYTVTDKLGKTRIFLQQIAVLPNGLAVTCRDITERKQIERMKNEFVSIVSHELRTPLTSIRGSLGLIMGGVAGSVSEQAESLLTIAYNNCERLVRLINDILDIEKIESGRMHFEYRPISVANLLEQAVEANALYAEKHSIRFDIEENEQLEAENWKVMADNDRVMQILTNLLSNAAKFSPKNSVVTLRVKSDHSNIRFEIEDKGPGITKEFQEHIFEKFSQADGSDSRQKGGTGLGLSIVKAIVEEMKGHVGFTTEPGSGTVFYFTLPLAHQENLISITKTNGVKPAILICEDDPDIAQLLRMVFERMGLQADIAFSALEADGFLKKNFYMAMTLDLQLPDKDGISFLRDLRNQERTYNLPIIVISVMAEEGRKKLEGDAFGAIDWLAKPIDVRRLTNIVQNLRSAHNRARILHVEDDADIAKVMSLTLAPMADVSWTAHLQEAKVMLQQDEFDLVILDVGLPDGVGTDLLPYVGSQAKNPIPVVLFTADEVSSDISRHVAAALVKSRTSEEALIATIQKIISETTGNLQENEAA